MLHVRTRSVDATRQVAAALEPMLRPGDVILLSPASEDSGSVNGYQHRGEMFRRSVELLAGTSTEAESTGKAGSASKIPHVLSR